MRLVACKALAVLAFCTRLSAGTPVQYVIHLSDPARHVLRITVRIPPGPDAVDLQLPVWNALYQVRDFSQFLKWIRAEDSGGRPIAITQINASRWKLSGASGGAQIMYEMFSDTPGPFGAELDPHHAFLNLAEVLIYAPAFRNGPQQVEFGPLPEDWKIATPLRRENQAYAADSYDQLVDSPVEIGKFEETTFTESCGRYRIVVDSQYARETLSRIVPAIQKVVGEATRWMDDCPFDLYTFIYHFSDSPARGGMEHAYSTAISTTAKSLDRNMNEFTDVTAHEFFHLWNVKRIRPRSLEPVDFTKENYTPSLWFSEGVDSTAGECIRLRAGVLDEPGYLKELGEAITELENRPAHLTQSVEQSSLDAWLEKYPFYGLPDRSISYYNKGFLIGVLLDLRMREASRDRASLQTLFRHLNEQYGKKNRPFDDSIAIREAAEQASGADLAGFFNDYVRGVREIPWNHFFNYVGLQVATHEVTTASLGFRAVQKFDQSPIVVDIEPGSSAERAGLRPGDAILAINGQPVSRDFQKGIEAVGPGGRLNLLVRGAEAAHTVQWNLGSRTQAVYAFENLPSVTAEQKEHRERWLFDGARP